MAGDLRLFRRRWWGFYPLAVGASGCVAVLASIAVGRLAAGQPLAAATSGILAAACALLVLVTYAPWTFHWAFRALGALICALYCAYVVSAMQTAGWWAGERPWLAVAGAGLGFVVIAIPGFLMMTAARGSVCPYDAQGRLVPLVERFEFRPASGADAPDEAWDAACVRLFAAIQRLRIPGVEVLLDEDGTHGVGVQVEIPASADPQAILALIREELHSQGIAAVSSPLAVAPEHL